MQNTVPKPPHLVDGLHAAHEPLLQLVVLGIVLQTLLVRLDCLVVLLDTHGRRVEGDGLEAWDERGRIQACLMLEAPEPGLLQSLKAGLQHLKT